MVDYTVVLFFISFLLDESMEKSLNVAFLNVVIQVILDSATGFIVDFACEVEITEQVFSSYSIQLSNFNYLVVVHFPFAAEHFHLNMALL